jgi:starch-binding outer membrane protein, SusD/RagB family
MKNNKLSLFLTIAAVSVLTLASCHKDLDKTPPNTLTPDQVYKNEAGYKQVLAKVYGSMALTGNTGPAGSGDVAGIDEGTSDLLRLYWKAQELSTDEALVAWNDPGIQDFHNMNWSSNNPMLIGLYGRCMFIITLSNEFLRESTPAKLSARGISGTGATNIAAMRAEARFVRALQYWILMDLYANPGFATDADAIGKFNPKQTNRTELFTFIEKELKEIETALPDARTNEYGRADKAAAWALLSRLYLNAKVYINTDKYTEAITYSKKVIDVSGYALLSDYRWLMLADNGINNNEFIFALNYDGVKTKNFGGTTFMVNASVGGDQDRTVSGLGGWGGIRSTKNLPQQFPDANGTADKRAQFFTGHNLEIASISEFKDGYAVTKYRNRTRTGGFGSDPDKTFSDVDFPMFRLAEIYLNYAEAVKRGGTGGSDAQAITYINNLRQRAYGNATGNIASYDLPFILNERSRELYWEGLRRTDLIRFGQFTEGAYLWPWKGGVKDGRGVEDFRKIYPLPSPEVAANPNLKQNPGY